MSGITIYRDNTLPMRKTAYRQMQENAAVGDKLAYTEDDKLRMDELVRTVDLKNADAGGLTYTLKTPEECPACNPTQKLTVREMTAEELRLNPVRYELSAQSGTVTDPFFHIDTDFIARHAKLIASGEDYSTDYASYDSTPEYFYGSVGKWFGEADFGGLKSSTVAPCREYAKRMESGGSLDLRSLETTFDICGEKLTLGQILDIRDMAKLLSGSSKQLQGRTGRI